MASQRVSFEDYWDHYAHDFYEWVDGELIDLRPVTIQHQELVAYLRTVLGCYFDLRETGEVISCPFLMVLEPNKTAREPDLQVILKTNEGNFTELAMFGAADICIEVVTQESIKRDYEDKLRDYEAAGVKEYWLIDPLRRAALFYPLHEDGAYPLIALDDQQYTTPLLPDLVITASTLWQDPLPNIFEIAESVRAMLEG